MARQEYFDMHSFFCFRELCWFIFFITCFSSSAYCADFIQVRGTLKPNESEQQIKQELLQDGFLQGVMSTASSLLETPVGPYRRQLLAAYLRPRVQGLVQSYSDLGLKKGENPLEIVQNLEVTINIPALKKILKHIGIFYTCDKPVYYLLHGERIEAGRVRNLEILYGLEQVKDEQHPAVELTLLPGASFGFKARLVTGSYTLEAGPAPFERVWEDIWGKYFSLPALALQGTSLSHVWLKGWKNSAEVYSFDKELRSWTRLVDSVQLDFVQLSTRQTEASWSVRSTNDLLLKEKIEQYLAQYEHLQLVYGDGSEDLSSF